MYISQTNKKHESIVMKKRSKYKPKGVRIDAVNWVLAGLKPFNTVSVGTDLRIKNHAAMDTLRRGDATRHDVDVLIGAFNMCEAYTMLRPELGADWQEEIRAGQDALLAVGQRGVASGRFILKAEELKAMNLVMEIHDAQLDQTTVRDLELAMDIIDKEHKAKKLRAIVVKEKETA
jgi:hypothetical protein